MLNETAVKIIFFCLSSLVFHGGRIGDAPFRICFSWQLCLTAGLIYYKVMAISKFRRNNTCFLATHCCNFKLRLVTIAPQNKN